LVARLLLFVAGRFRAHKIWQVLAQLNAFLGGTADPRQQFAPPSLINLALQHLRAAQNDAQKIVDVLRPTAVHLTIGREIGRVSLALLSRLPEIHGYAIP